MSCMSISNGSQPDGFSNQISHELVTLSMLHFEQDQTQQAFFTAHTGAGKARVFLRPSNNRLNT